MESQWIELQNWGYNQQTASFLAVMCFTIIGSIGFYHQMIKIWKEKSGAAMSIPLWTSYVFVFATFSIYGFDGDRKSLALVIQGIARNLLMIPIAIGLLKYEGFTKKQWMIIVLLFAGIFFQVVSSYKALVYLVYSYVGIGFACTQPLKMWREKSRGVVSSVMLATNTGSVIFWIIFGLLTGQYPICYMGAGYTVVYLSAIVLWILFPDKPVARQTQEAT